MADTITTFTAALKETYTDEVVRELLYKDNPFYKLVGKEEDFGGLPYFRTPLLISPSGAVSSSFSNAQAGAAATASGVKEFRVDRLNAYSLNQIDDLTVMASQGKVSAFLKASQVFVESTLYRLGRDLAISMYGDGWGARAQISSGFTTVTLVLTAPNDALRFEIGDRLDVNTNKGDAAKARGSSGNPLIVTGVDADLGTLTFGYAVNDATNGIPSIANGDYLYLAGDASTAKTKLTGLAGWLPTTAPASNDSFFGLNRSINPQRLAGVRLVGSTLNIIEVLNNAAVQVAKVGGKTTHFLMSFNTYQNLINSLEGKVKIVDHKDQEVGFPSIEVITPRGKAMVVADINCPDNVVYGLQMDTWKMVSLGSAAGYQIGADFGDGLMFTRVYNADAWELRYRFSGGLTCFAPGWNSVTSLV